MDNHTEIDEILRTHRRRRWWPWRCMCGSRYPCSPRRRAVDESLRMAAREAVEWYPRYFARRAHAESAAEPPRPEPNGSGGSDHDGFGDDRLDKAS
jgi:hypothetical protein